MQKRLLAAALALVCLFAWGMGAAGAEGRRVVCLAPSMVEVVYALGREAEIVGWSAYTDYPPAATATRGYEPYQNYYDTDVADFDPAHELNKEVAVVGKYFAYNAEILAALRPTLVLCEGDAQAEWLDELRAAGYQAYCYDPDGVEAVFAMMVEVGDLLERGEQARELVAGYRARLEAIRAVTAELTPIRTYFEIAHQTDLDAYGVYGPYTEGAGTPISEMIALAGGVNIFADLTGNRDLHALYGEDAFAEIAGRDPQVILSPYWPGAYDSEVTTLYEIMTRPGFAQTAAVKDGRVCYYDSSLMKRFGPRTVTAIEKLAYLLHPYYFANPADSVSPWELGRIDRAEPCPAPLD